MLFLINNTLQFYSKVSNGKSNSIYLARTDVFPWGNPIKGSFICLTKKLKMKLLPHQDFNPKSEEKFFLKKGKIISWAELFKAGLR